MAEESKRDRPGDVAGLVESAFLMGIGVLEMTREKANELADELIERGKMSTSDAKQVADKISDVAERQQDAMRATVVNETDRAMRSAGMVTKRDLDELRAEIVELKAMIKAGSGVDVDSAVETIPE